MAKFRIKAGSHVQDGKRYVKGDVVENNANLAELFKEKFEPVAEDATSTANQPSSEKLAPTHDARTGIGPKDRDTSSTRKQPAFETEDEDEETTDAGDRRTKPSGGLGHATDADLRKASGKRK